MTYASYKYYKEEFGGTTVPKELFQRCASFASRQIDYFTFGRIADRDSVKGLPDCTCEMAETVYNIRYKDEGKVKKSENIDGYSVTWLTERKDGEDFDTILQGKLYSICSSYLAYTGLMYRGVG